MRSIFRTGILSCALLAAPLLLSTSCVAGLQTNRLPVNIGFKPVIGHDTRADESVPFPEDRTFRLWAINEDTGDIHIDNEEIRYAGGWTSSKKWPDARLSVRAYWPTDINPSFDKSNGLSISSFDCREGNKDILLAKAGHADVGKDSLITLAFDHLLSRVEFRMQHSLASDIDVRLKKIEVIGFGAVGKYANGYWTVDNKNHARVIYDAAGSEGTLLTKEPVYFGEDFFTIPQVCTASVEVSFDIRYNQGTWIPQKSVIESLNTHWEPSTHYTYSLNLTDSKLACTTGISNWNNRE